MPTLNFSALSLSSLLWAFLATQGFAQTSTVNEGVTTNCSCYTVTNSTSSSLFTNHMFFDFRKLDEGPAASIDFSIPPPAVSDSENTGSEPATFPYFLSADFKNQWNIQTWKRAASSASPVSMVNSARNVYISRDSKTSPTHLTLRTTRLAGFQSAAEIDSIPGNYMHASIRAKARVRGSPGAVAGIFTYADDDNESDIEILTNGLDTGFHATNQPGNVNGNPVAGATSFSPIKDTIQHTKNSSWTGWTTYRLDWTPTKTEWFANGHSVSNKTYSVPRKPSYFILNVWSDGGSWSGEMGVGGVATMDIEWVEMAYNTTSSGTCSGGTICTVADERMDEAGTGVLGVPRPLLGSVSQPPQSLPTTTSTPKTSISTKSSKLTATTSTTTSPKPVKSGGSKSRRQWGFVEMGWALAGLALPVELVARFF